MHHVITKPTWSILLRGLIALLIGLFALFAPDITLSVLVILVGIYIFANGILAIIFSIYGKLYGEPHWWFYLLEGLAGTIIGIIIFSAPIVTSIFLIYIIAIWAVITGILQIIAYIRLQKIYENELLILASGIISLVIGLILFKFPTTGIMTITWVIGLYAFIFGIITIVSAFRSKKRI